MSRLNIDKKAQVVGMLVEGCSIKTTPALASGVADHRWTLEELVEWVGIHGR